MFFCMELPFCCICCSMRTKRKHFHRLLRAAELPEDLNPHLLAVRWIGGTDLVVEQHRGILRFDADEIRFLSEQGTLRVIGSALMLDVLTESSAYVCGTIRTLSFEEKS